MRSILMMLLSAGFILASSGCKMAKVDRHAVRICLDFSEPESFPFMKLDRLKLQKNGHSAYQWASGLSDAEIKSFLEQGYTKEYLIFARLYLYVKNTATDRWEPVTQYDVLYLGIADGYLWPRKKDSYHPGKALLDFNGRDRTGPYASIDFTNAILDFSEQPTITLKIVTIPSIGDAEARCWTTDIKREELGLWIDEFRQNIWPFDWSVYLPEAKITLPPWNKWQIELAPPVPEPRPPAEEIVVKIDNGGKDSPGVVYEVQPRK